MIYFNMLPFIFKYVRLICVYVFLQMNPTVIGISFKAIAESFDVLDIVFPDT